MQPMLARPSPYEVGQGSVSGRERAGGGGRWEEWGFCQGKREGGGLQVAGEGGTSGAKGVEEEGGRDRGVAERARNGAAAPLARTPYTSMRVMVQQAGWEYPRQA